MIKKRLIIVFLSLISLTTALAVNKVNNANTSVTADFKGFKFNQVPSYKRGEEVIVTIDISNNPGFHGLYFDLLYDQSILSFDRISKSEIFLGSMKNNDLLQGFSNRDGKGRVICSYTRMDKVLPVSLNGSFINIHFFTLPNSKSGEYELVFNSFNLLDKNGAPIENVNFNVKRKFEIKQVQKKNQYVHISTPNDNEIFYNSATNLNIICSPGNYKVVLKNKSLKSKKSRTVKPDADGIITDANIHLAVGRNNIVAELYHNNGDYITSDMVSIYYSSEKEIIRITSPKDSELLNSDMVLVELEAKSEYSTGKGVLVNGVTAKEVKSFGSIKKYRASIWLKEGVNNISAIMEGKSGEKYKDSINIYYKKDSNHFEFISPKIGESYKPKKGLTLDIKGEIGSKYSDKINLSTGRREENKLSFDIIHRSINGDTYKVVSHLDGKLSIKESLVTTGSRYSFSNDSPIKLEDIPSGELIISAYKNRDENSWDDKITRVVKIDSNRLWINLLQPNVYTSDTIETYQDIKDFNRSEDMISENVEISLDGAFGLKSSNHVIELSKTSTNSLLENVVSVVEANDGVYSLVNKTLENNLVIYKKEFSKKVWKQVANLDNHYGYTLCKIGKGILVGVVDNDNTSGRGLYLLEGSKLSPVNIDNVILRNVQFITHNNGNVYLYGNYYNSLYSFTTHDLIPENGGYRIPVINEISFKNSWNIEQFHLSSDGNSAMVRNDLGEVHFFTKKLLKESGEYKFAPSGDRANRGLYANYVVFGEYNNGDYITSLLFKDNSSFEIVMLNKKSGEIYSVLNSGNQPFTFSGFLNNSSISSPIGAGFYNDEFSFIYNENGKYQVEKGKVFFKHFYPSSGINKLEYTGSISGAMTSDRPALITKDSVYIHCENKLVNAFSEYPNQGSCSFKYANDHIDSLTGFSFEVDKKLAKSLKTDSDSTVSFRLVSNSSTTTIDNELKWKTISLFKLLNSKVEIIDGYQISQSSYVHDRDTERVKVHIGLGKEQSGKYFEFKINFKSFGNATPKIYNFQVYKKIFPKICRTESKTSILPIRGLVEDSTVEYVTIDVKGNYFSSRNLKLEEGGAFYYNLEFSEKDLINSFLPISIYCSNRNNENYVLDFDIEVIDSRCNIWDTGYGIEEKTGVINVVDDNSSQIFTKNGTINIEASYFGLVKSLVGYELFKIDGSGKENILTKGVLNKREDNTVTLPVGEKPLGSGYELGKISKQGVKLFPGKQYIRIYCQNPGGIRKEVIYPAINYNIPKDYQKITFDLSELPGSNVNKGVPIGYIKSLEALEGTPVTNFELKESKVTGRVESLSSVNSVIVKSYNPGLLLIDELGNKSTEIRVKTDIGNRFTINYEANLSKLKHKESFDVGVIPENANLKHIQRGFRIAAKKVYKETTFIPDFSIMDQEQWSEEEKKAKEIKIPFRFKLNRDDLPLPKYTNNEASVYAVISLNHEHNIEGNVVSDNGIYYIEKNGNRQFLVDSMLKRGVNRLKWRLEYLEYNSIDKKWYKICNIASSNDNDPQKKDHLFNYTTRDPFTKTLLSFNPPLTGKYYKQDSTNWPVLNIEKDKRTKVVLGLTYKGVRTDFFQEEGVKSVIPFDYKELKDHLREGKNRLNIDILEDGVTSNYSYIYNYDSRPPVVSVESYKFDSSFDNLKELVINIDEANFKEAVLYYDAQLDQDPAKSSPGSIVNDVLPKTIIKSSNQYQLVWKWINPSGISSKKDIYVKVLDRAGREALTVPLYNHKKDTVTNEEVILENPIVMPVYGGDENITYPELSNEYNRLNREFSNHTKFAPSKFLKKNSVKTSLKAGNNYLLKKSVPHDPEPVYWSRMENAANVRNGERGTAHLFFDNHYEPGSDDIFNPRANAHGHKFENRTAKFGNNLLTMSNHDSTVSRVTVHNTGAIDRGVISLWSYTDTNMKAPAIRRGTGELIVKVRGQQVFWSGVMRDGGSSGLYGGNFFGQPLGIRRGLHHYYLVWDKSGKLTAPDGSKGHTHLLYLNGAFIGAKNNPVSNNIHDIQVLVSANAPTSGYDDWGLATLDNLKVWDYIPSDNPGWLNIPHEQEDLTKRKNFLNPVYYSQVESWDRIASGNSANNEVGSANIINRGSAFNFTNNSSYVKDNYGLYGYSETGDKAVFSVNNTGLSKGTISHWSYFNGQEGKLTTYLSDNVYFSVGSGRGQIVVNGNAVGSVEPVNGLNHVYAVWDKERKLAGGKSIRIFCNSKEVGFATVLLDSAPAIESQNIKFQLYSNKAHVSLDRLKIWNSVISEDPWYSGELKEISLFDKNYGKYLVFKVDRSANEEISDKATPITTIANGIRIEVVGKKNVRQPDGVTMVPTETAPINLIGYGASPIGFNSLVSDDYFYFYISRDKVIEKYKEVVNSLADPTNGELRTRPDRWVVVDPGSIRVAYKESWMNFEPVDVYFTGFLNTPGKINTSISDLVFYDSGYDSNTVSGNYIDLNSALKAPMFETEESINDRSFICTGNKDNLSINFWIRLEDEDGSTLESDPYNNKIRNILSNSLGSTDIFRLFYKREDRKYKLYYRVDGNVGLIGAFNNSKPDWDMITVIADRTEGKLKFYFNGASSPTLEVNVANDTLAQILRNKGHFYFGSRPRELSSSGFFSIANPFYINKRLQNSEILRYFKFRDFGAGVSELAHEFNTSSSEFKSGSLSKIGTYGHVSLIENSDYSVKSGSLKASREHLNLLKVKDGKILLSEASANILVNSEVITTAGSMILSPKLETGFYYFGNKVGNYGLKADRWYSISGEVLNKSTDLNAVLVLRIDNKEQEFELKKGRFHYVFENTKAYPNPPKDLVMYIKLTDTNKLDSTPLTIELSKDMVLNNGNYKISDSMGRTAVHESFPFNSNGTVHFWYKPFNYNKNGFVNYESVIFDSNYFKIYSALDPEGNAVYKAEMKNKNKEVAVFLPTNNRVINKWSHLQLSWSCSNKSFYFYVDGNLASSKEGAVMTPYGSFIGDPDKEDNLFIGSDMSAEIFAEGYIDDVLISQFFKGSVYEPRKSPELEYVSENSNIVMNNPGSHLVENLYYKLEALDGSFYDYGEVLNYDVKNLAPGRYRFTTEALVNKLNFDNIIAFNIDSKPSFSVSGHTPIVFSNIDSTVTDSINFTLRYDDSHRYKKRDREYAAAVIKISYDHDKDSLTPDVVKKRIITQGYNQDINKWQIYDPAVGNSVWKELKLNKFGEIPVTYTDIKSSGNVKYEVKCLYFNEVDKNLLEDVANKVNPIVSDIIPVAAISYSNEKYTHGDKSYEYKLKISAASSGSGSLKPNNDNQSSILENVEINYVVTQGFPERIIVNGSSFLDKNGELSLYYDDILKECPKDSYKIDLYLKYKGHTYSEIKDVVLKLDFPDKEKVVLKDLLTPYLKIEDLSVLYLDKSLANNCIGTFYLKYRGNNVDDISYKLEVISNGEVRSSIENKLFAGDTSYIFNDIPIPVGRSVVKITLKAKDLSQTKEIDINNFNSAPEITVSNAPKSQIAYNNVLFSWKGYLKNEDGNKHFNSGIQYSYNFDNMGWTKWNKDWKSVNFYELEEGYHNFKVKALYEGVESDIRSFNFFVDIKRPVFNENKITVDKIYGAGGILKKVNITGVAGSIKDASLRSMYIDGLLVDNFNPITGEFVISDLPVLLDGKNLYELKVFDKVGNSMTHPIVVNNDVTSILFPGTDFVKYCPMTIVGQLSSEINAPVDIYVKDPFYKKGEEKWSGWKKAQINEDRTFFIEDVFVNPGNSGRIITTTLEIATVFENGQTVFTKKIPVKAMDVLMPIEMSLSSYAVQGDNTDTLVKINCSANVGNISSWSIDFDGDGLYDQIEQVHGKNTLDRNTHFWDHKYSNLGNIKPRVRIITKDGSFFSVSKSLIIHERIVNGSNKQIVNPLAMDLYNGVDGSTEVYVLRSDNQGSFVEKYSIGKHAGNLSGRKNEIKLSELGITIPLNRILVLGKDHFAVAGEFEIYEISANKYGDFIINNIIDLKEKGIRINDITKASNYLYITNKDNGSIAKLSIHNGYLSSSINLKIVNVNVKNSVALDKNSWITAGGQNLLVTDFMNQRILELDEELKPNGYYGHFGTGAGEFLKPSIIDSYENRTLVFDRARHDVQVFDNNLKTVTTLKYDLKSDQKYLDANFFTNIVDIGLISRVDDKKRVFYYALLLSKSSGKLAVLKLPRWEELRARVRNNKIVFLQNGDVFSAKPDGGDLSRVISSDSIPMIEGKLEYPALSPDGRSLVFTSMGRLYNGRTGAAGGNNDYAYDNLYVVDIISKELNQIDLGSLNGYEIERPVFSSNGDKLIFSAKRSGSNWQLYTFNFETKGVEKVFSSGENARFPYFSPDDRFIVFTTDHTGNEEIEIIDTQNTGMRVSVTDNFSRDSLPVWISIYPEEIGSEKNTKIESKIAFVSERDYHKGVYYTYIKHNSVADLRVVNFNGDEVGNNPDSAAVEITGVKGVSTAKDFVEEGGYPCFTGDGKSVIFQSFNGIEYVLKKYNFKNDGALGTFSEIQLPQSAEKPSGMKNMLTNFKAEQVNGNEIALSWDRYTKNDIPYYVQYKVAGSTDNFVQKKVFSQESTAITGLKMGSRYQVRVCIIDQNKQEVATSFWRYIDLPDVAAIPSYTIDKENPYLVHLNAWKPEERCLSDKKDWKFTWIVDNREVSTSRSRDFMYEFSTHGPKTIILKVGNSTDTTNSFASVNLDVKSDIEPVITYEIAGDAGSVTLDASYSKGKKINFADTQWVVTGPGYSGSIIRNESLTSVDLTGFKREIYVTLKLKRQVVNDQQTTDVIEKTKVIDLDIIKVKPVITTEVSQENNRLIKFSGDNSFGNIDWRTSKWILSSDSGIIAQHQGVSSFYHTFPETNNNGVYYVGLTLSSLNNGMSETISQIVNVEAAPIEPIIDYEILELKDENRVVGAKLLLNCTKSSGSNIDFNQAKWNVATLGGNTGDQAQFGPTASFNVMTNTENMIMDVSLTLSRRNGDSPVTVTKLVTLDQNEVPSGELIVERSSEDYSNGQTITLDVLKSTGPNIIWEKTTWFVDGNPYPQTGPMIKVDVPYGRKDRNLDYVCSLYRSGGVVETKRGFIEIDKVGIEPIITIKKVSDKHNNLYQLSVLETKGFNIDWERSKWIIFDGNQQVVEKRGSEVRHAFTFDSNKMGYPVSVEMFLNGASKPFIGYTTVDVEADELLPIIKYKANKDNPNIITFDATSSKGSNIDWTNLKWTFGDSSEQLYGSSVVKTFPNSESQREYRVALTLLRRNVNGSVESKVAHKDIIIGSNKIRPKIRVEKRGETLFLSAEESEGQGLMLDRSLWNFNGSGDTNGSVANVQEGYAVRQSSDFGSSLQAGVDVTASAGVGVDFGKSANSPLVSYSRIDTSAFLKVQASAGLHHNIDRVIYKSSDYFNGQKSFSNQNSHTGATCRRSVNNSNTIYVTLTVFRVEADGGIKAESITVGIDPSNVQSLYQ